MEPKFTPGPWYVTGEDFYRVRRTSTDEVLATIEDGGQVDPEFALSDDEQFANAHLIAAAPDLYEALQQSADLITKMLGADTITGRMAAEALAKARGES